MLHSVKSINGYDLAATDGTIGHAREVYFDDERWVVRHLVADTGGWLLGRKVFISPHSVERLDDQHRQLALRLTREQIKEAPGIETDKPVSRQHEISYYDYYGYPYYWTGSELWGMYPLPNAADGLVRPPPDAQPPSSQDADIVAAMRNAEDKHLRSSAEVLGYHIEASDGAIGHIDDLLFDDSSWQIRWAVIDTRNWLPGRLVLLPRHRIIGFDWNARRAHVAMTREAVKSSPGFEPDHRLSEDDERSVQRHYEGWQ